MTHLAGHRVASRKEMHPAPEFPQLEAAAYDRPRLASLSVALVGVGALGAEVSRLLGMLDVGCILLIDPDIVETGNYVHSPAVRISSSISRSKAEVFAEYNRATFTRTEWFPFPVEIADVGFGDLEECDLIFSCTDNALARTESAWVSQRLGIPMVDGGLMGSAWWKGRVSWFPGTPDSACYLCQLSHTRRAELLSQSLAISLSCTGRGPASQAFPTTPAMSSLVAAMQVEFGLRSWASGAASCARAWEISLDHRTPAMESLTIPRSGECPWHEPALQSRLHVLPEEQTLRDSLREAGATCEILADWPLCLSARCLRCGHEWQPMQRVARVRRNALCPQCRQANPLPLQVIARVRAEDEWARHTPGQLGFPSNHRYTLGRAG
jgi:hypothetical protein